MALVMTVLTVIAMLGGITLLLWVCTVVEARHLGPRVVDSPAAGPSEPVAAPALHVSEAA